jgi:hypothetical protein
MMPAALSGNVGAPIGAAAALTGRLPNFGTPGKMRKKRVFCHIINK